MAKNYSVFARAYAGVIKRGRRTIEDVRPDELKQQVIEILANEGLGPDGKSPINNKDQVGPKGEPGEPGIIPEDGNSGDIEEKEESKEPVEDKKEDEPTKDTKEEEKEPVSNDKGGN